MHDSRQQRLQRLLRARLFTLVLLLVVVFLFPAVWGAYSKERESYQNKVEAETQLAQLGVRETQLKKEVDHLETSRGMEGALRHQYEVGSSGEGVVYIVEREASTTTLTPEEQNPFVRWFKGWWPFW